MNKTSLDVRHGNRRFGLASCRWLVCLGLLLVTPAVWTHADDRLPAVDTVVVATGKHGEGRLRRSGRVIAFTSDGLILQTESGRQSTIPADRVVDIETRQVPSHREGDAARAAGRFSEAIGHYEATIRSGAEKRDWVRRRILAALVRCKHAIGAHDAAGHYFASLVRDDPRTPYFDAIPLAWISGQQVDPRRTTEWLGDPMPAIRLLGASYGLTTARRAAAVAVLGNLAKNADPPVAQLASAQLWRTQTTTATADQVTQWSGTIDAIPQSLRAGPYYVFGTTLIAQGEHQRAAVALMRVPILHADRTHLAAESLLQAGKSLVRLDHVEEAARVFRELIAGFPESNAAAEARQRLQDIQKK